MLGRPARFWLSAIGVTLAVVVGARLLLPYGWLGIETAAERTHAWLLTIWTSGVFLILFGISALLGVFSGIGFRDVSETGSVAAAMEKREEAEAERRALTGWGDRLYGNFGWWLVATGVLLVAAYFTVWIVPG